jgi:exopolysaccharide biosynthesis polyprenyl glycosylphosphotransferase
MLLHYRTRGLNFLLAISSAAAACGLFWLVAAGLFAAGLKRPLADLEAYWMCTLIIGMAIFFNGMRLSLKQVDLAALNVLAVARLSVTQVFFVAFALFMALFALKDQSLSRLVIATYIPLLFIVLFAGNIHFPRVFAKFLFSGQHRHKTMLIGAPESAVTLRHWIARKQAYGIDVVGILLDHGVPNENSGVPILGTKEDLRAQLQTTGCTQVILVGFPPSSNAIKEMAENCERFGVRFMVLADWAGMLGRRLTVREDQGMQMLSFQDEPLQCPWNRAFKRALDLAISVPIVLFVLPWTIALVWVLQRLQSPGPLFFLQRRTGMQGRTFVIFKYRSMHVDHGDESRQATPNDERVFRAGRWMRRLSIDELPQFINVMRGEMSVVGPRPHIAAHDQRFEAQTRRYRIRHLVKPGITGLAQVRGYRGETRCSGDVVRRIRADLQYIQEWTLFMDVLIVAKTALLCFRPNKASY